MVTRPKLDIDLEKIAADLGRLDEVSERVRLANFGLAAPLIAMRKSQMEREVARVAARKGADDPEVAARRDAATRAGARFGLFRAELARTQVEPPSLKGEKTAGIWGRVVRGREPVAEATVIGYAGGKRATFTCTKANGGFSIEVPGGEEITLSVLLKEAGEAFRDREGTALKPRQIAFREIDLGAAPRPCPKPPPDREEPKEDSFPMIQLIGQLEADAHALIKAQGLVLGERSEKVDVERAGRILDQKPAVRAKVRAGDAVALVVAVDDRVETPSVLGLTLEDAELVLLKAELKAGEVARTPVERERAGRVLNQKPVAGDRVQRRSAVALEIGVAGREPPKDGLDPKLTRIAELAGKRLAEAGEGASEADLAKRLIEAKVRRLADLDKLIEADRPEIRNKLGFRTLAETDRAVAALKRARKDLER